jgi:hypothetical protein
LTQKRWISPACAMQHVQRSHAKAFVQQEEGVPI